MIARIWHGRTPADEADAYVDYLRETGIATHESTEGNRGDLVLRRVRDGVADFLVISLWDGETAVRRFAGPNPDVAVYFPEDDRFLLEKEPHCDHYEIVHAPSSLGPAG